MKELITTLMVITIVFLIVYLKRETIANWWANKSPLDRKIYIYKIAWISLIFTIFTLAGWYMNEILSFSNFLGEVFSIKGAWISWPIILWIWYIIPFCLKVVKGQEHGVKILFGIPYAYVDSGLQFILWPVENIYIYTKKRMRTDVKKQEVVTKSAEDNRSGANGNKLLTLAPEIDTTLYWAYPRSYDLIEVYKSVSKDDEEVKLLFEDAIKNGVRVAAGGKNWQECTQGAFQNTILENLRDKPIDRAQEIFNYEVEITELKLPEEFRKALSEKLASIAKAEGEKQGIALKGEGEAKARKTLFDAVNNCDNWQLLEAFLSFREMAQSDNKWIVGLPDSLQRVLGNITGSTTRR